MRIIFLFIDGLGLGTADPAVNPCMDESLTHLRFFENGKTASEASNGGMLVPADACLGVAGLPQSASGQTALLTGVNAAELIGRHLPGFPNQTLRTVLKENSVLKRIREAGFRAAFANAYRPLFFGLKEATRWRLSATTVATLAAGLPFFSTELLSEGGCVYHDLTNESLIERGFDVPRWTPGQAGKVLKGIADAHDFVLYEYFLTDRAGHGQDRRIALRELQKLDDFISSILESFNPLDTLLLLASDHGNIEDLSVKTHTRNRVPVIAWGKGRERIAEKVRSILDVTPALLGLFAVGAPAEGTA
jgi:2,3-bisphosphoglycerate-independent phosphoglycerate mutase